MILNARVPVIFLGAVAILVGSFLRAAEAPCPVMSELEGSFRVSNGAAPPGGQVAIPFSVRGNFDVGVVSFSVDFDEEVLEAVGLERIYQRPDGEDFYWEKLGYNNSNASPGNAGIDEGYLGGAAVFNLEGKEGLIPPLVEQEVYRLHFRVRPEASPQTTEIRFLNGAMIRSSETPFFNVIQGVAQDFPDCGFSMRPEMHSSFVLLSGLLEVLPDVTAFIRGDTNGDRELDLSDAQSAFSYLFLGGPDPACFDAADANDDGKLDVSDPVVTLRVLFLDGGALPPPAGEVGEDPTPDSLGCLFRS